MSSTGNSLSCQKTVSSTATTKSKSDKKQQQQVLRYAPTIENERALAGGIELSKTTLKLLQQSEQCNSWKTSAKRALAAKRAQQQQQGTNSEPTNNLTTSSSVQVDQQQKLSNTNKSTHAFEDEEDEPAPPRRAATTLENRTRKGLSWPVVLDRVISKRKSSMRVQRRKEEQQTEEGGTQTKNGHHDHDDDGSCEPESNAQVLETELRILNEEEENDDDEDEEVEFSIRREILRFILGWKFEIFLLILLAMDVILLIVELELQTRVVCHITWDRSVSSVNVPSGSPFLASPTTIDCSNASDIEYSCEHGRSFTLPQEYAVCPFYVTEELPHSIHTAEIVINWVSRTIIILFALEILALIFCSGISILFRHKMYLLDFLVITVSIVLDIISALLHLDRASELIVIARVWRFARIVHGVGVSVHDVDEHEMADEEEIEEEKDELVEEFFPGSSPRLRKKELQQDKEGETGAGGVGKEEHKFENEKEGEEEKE